MKRWWMWIQPAVLGAAGAATAMAATGVTLNLFLGGTAYAAALAPTFAQHDPKRRWGIAAIFTAMIAAVWLVAVADRAVSPMQWVSLSAVAMSVVAVEVAAGELLESLGTPVDVAGMLVLLAAIAWGTWPVWGSLRLSDAGAPHVVPLHPLFAINGVVANFGIWTEQPMPYRLTAFGQNVAYRLPSTAFDCVALHGALAGVFAIATHSASAEAQRRKRGKGNATKTVSPNSN